MSALDILSLSTSAYLADTTHLSNAQHGSYLLILMAMWRSGGWIADDEKLLANISKLTIDKWRKISPTVRALLIIQDGKLSQKRLLADAENELWQREKNRRSGSTGGIAKSLKNKEQDLATASFLLGDRYPIARNESDSALPLLTTSESKIEIQKEKKVSNEERKQSNRGTPLPNGWQPSNALVEYGLALGLDQREIDSHAEDMKLWAAANANRAVGRKADWGAAFQGWLRREATKRKTGTSRPRQPTFAEIGSGRIFNEH